VTAGVAVDLGWGLLQLGSAIAKGRYSWGLSHSYGSIARTYPYP